MAKSDAFKGEGKIKKIGGRLSLDYFHIKRVILDINTHLSPLFSALALKEEDTDVVLTALKEGFSALKSGYIERNTARKIEEGLTSETEAEQAIERRDIHRQVTSNFNTIYKEYMETHKNYLPPFSLFYNASLAICREALSLNHLGALEINVDLFIKLYKSYLAGDESKRGKLHKLAAAAINAFFNGNPITERELSLYFIIEGGKFKINPSSVNEENYSRLGPLNP